jgi:hypothetical protein
VPRPTKRTALSRRWRSGWCSSRIIAVCAHGLSESASMGRAELVDTVDSGGGRSTCELRLSESANVALRLAARLGRELAVEDQRNYAPGPRRYRVDTCSGEMGKCEFERAQTGVSEPCRPDRTVPALADLDPCNRTPTSRTTFQRTARIGARSAGSTETKGSPTVRQRGALFTTTTWNERRSSPAHRTRAGRSLLASTGRCEPTSCPRWLLGRVGSNARRWA